MLISATMYHLGQSLKLILPHVYQTTPMRVQRNIMCYNAFCALLIILYFGMVVFIFFFRDIEAKLVLSLNLFMRIVMLAVYLITVFSLLSKLQHFPKEAMKAEVTSIKRQFSTFFIGFSLQAVYNGVQIALTKTNFALECAKTVVLFVSFMVPILVVLVAHHITFRGVKDVTAKNRDS